MVRAEKEGTAIGLPTALEVSVRPWLYCRKKNWNSEVKLATVSRNPFPLAIVTALDPVLMFPVSLNAFPQSVVMAVNPHLFVVFRLHAVISSPVTAGALID